MSDLTGRALGRYHILERLGEGGMAVVYKAYDTRLEREVAVKVIRTEKLTQENMDKAIKRFQRETKALVQLTHPNIVPIIDYGEETGIPYLVMDYIPGGTLKERLKRGPVTWKGATKLLIPIAQALDYAHKKHIIHRDVKPSNILITKSGQPMLTDFGIAKILDVEETADLTGTSLGVGTPEYMAPEQVTKKVTDHRVDIYALGIVFYEMVIGRKPFQAETPLAVLLKHVNDPLPSPKTFGVNLPRPVERVLLKALAKEPENRYQSMGEFVVALTLLSSGKMQSHTLGEKISYRRVFPILGIMTLTVLLVTVLSGDVNNVARRMLHSIGLQTSTATKYHDALGTLAVIQTRFVATRTAKALAPGLSLTISLTPTSVSTSTPVPVPTSTSIFVHLPASSLLTEFKKVIFDDDFELGEKVDFPLPPNWRIIQDESGNHVLLAEKLDDTPEEGVSLGSTTWQNYRLSFRVKFPAQDGHPSLFISLRSNSRWEQQGRYASRYNVSFVLNQWLSLGKKNPGSDDFELASMPLQLVPDKWYRIDIIADNSRFVVAIDGQPMLDYTDTDSPIHSGRIEMDVWNDGINFETGLGGAVKILMDDISVYTEP